MNRAFDMFFKHSFGFDSLDQAFGDTVLPYNIVALDGNTYQYQQAVAGYPKDTIDVYTTGNTLTIETTDSPPHNTNVKYLHKGLMCKPFKITMPISNDIVVQSAKVEDGILYVTMVKKTKTPETHRIAIS